MSPVEGVGCCHGDDNGCPHPLQSLVSGGVLVDRLVGRTNCCREQFVDLVPLFQSRQQILMDKCGRHMARDIAIPFPAHAIGHDEDAVRGIGHATVFIVVPDDPRITLPTNRSCSLILTLLVAVRIRRTCCRESASRCPVTGRPVPSFRPWPAGPFGSALVQPQPV